MSEVGWTPGPDALWHSFAGDPWGSCSRCGHPAYHSIHNEDVAEQTRRKIDAEAEALSAVLWPASPLSGSKDDT